MLVRIAAMRRDIPRLPGSAVEALSSPGSGLVRFPCGHTDGQGTRLRSAGIGTLAQLAQAPATKVPHVAPHTLETLHDQAGLQLPDIDEDLSTEGLLRGAPAPRGSAATRRWSSDR